MSAMTEFQQGVYLSDLSPGSVFDVETRSRRSRIEYLGGIQVRISGHPVICPIPIVAELRGSTSDSGSFEASFIGHGMHLEFRPLDERIAVTTSKIVDIKAEPMPPLRALPS